MAYYKPCKNCAVDKATCNRRSDVAAAIAGLSVTSINFRCTDRQPLFHPGQRISLNWTAWETFEYEDYGLGLIYHGTVLAEHGLRFIVRIDDAPSADGEKIDARDTFKSENLTIKAKPAYMQAIDEPDRQLCPVCAAYDGEKSRCQGWGQRGTLDSYWPEDCSIVKAEGKS